MDINGFHLELTNICTLKCPGCARTQFRNIMPHHWQNKSLDIDSALRFMDIDLTKDEALQFIKKEYRKWNGRLNTLSPGNERDNAQRMLDALARLREKYEKE